MCWRYTPLPVYIHRLTRSSGRAELSADIGGSLSAGLLSSVCTQEGSSPSPGPATPPLPSSPSVQGRRMRENEPERHPGTSVCWRVGVLHVTLWRVGRGHSVMEGGGGLNPLIIHTWGCVCGVHTDLSLSALDVTCQCVFVTGNDIPCWHRDIGGAGAPGMQSSGMQSSGILA